MNQSLKFPFKINSANRNKIVIRIWRMQSSLSERKFFCFWKTPLDKFAVNFPSPPHILLLMENPSNDPKKCEQYWINFWPVTRTERRDGLVGPCLTVAPVRVFLRHVIVVSCRVIVTSSPPTLDTDWGPGPDSAPPPNWSLTLRRAAVLLCSLQFCSSVITCVYCVLWHYITLQCPICHSPEAMFRCGLQ